MPQILPFTSMLACTVMGLESFSPLKFAVPCVTGDLLPILPPMADALGRPMSCLVRKKKSLYVGYVSISQVTHY